MYNSAVAAAVDALKKVPLFEDLDSRELQDIANSMRERRVAAGDVILEQGAAGAGFFVVDQGMAEVTVDGDPVAIVGPGDYFGEIALLTGSDRTATVTAQTDMVCYGLTTWDFKPLVEGNSAIAWKLLTAMARKLR